MTSTRDNYLDLPDGALQELKFLAKEQGISIKDVLIKAIVHEKFITRELKRGSKILIQNPDKSINRVVFYELSRKS